VTVIDTASQTVTDTISVGDHPVGLAINPSGTRVYVTNVGGTVSVVDTATNSVTATINVGSEPTGVKVTADGSRLLVANSGGTSTTSR
jgi:YVTN family beta-propeller protein